MDPQSIASTNFLVSGAGLQNFTLFEKLPKELRFMIWKCTLVPRIVELLASDDCTGGFYSQAALPTALHVCKESREETQKHYKSGFGSFLQPSRILFNYNIDVLYIDLALEEDCLHRLFAVWKETEMASLKYIAIDDGYVENPMIEHRSSVAGLRKAVRSMKVLKEMIMVRDITNDTRPHNHPMVEKVQMKFYSDDAAAQIEEDMPIGFEKLPHANLVFKGWKPSKAVQTTAVYGWRTL